MTDKILSLENITKYYDKQKVIEEINLQIKKGRIYGLLGPNGAGKTTLLRIINRIINPTSGVVYFNGQTMRDDDLNYLGYMPEERGVYRDMGVEEQSIYFGMLRGLKRNEAKKRANIWFEKLEMGAWKHKKASALSKGMAQKLQFVITVLHNPRLLILDEPFSGFDPVNAIIVKDEIMRLKDEGSSIILSTHRMESIDELCDDISIIYKSKKVLDGNIQELRRQNTEGFIRIGIKSMTLNNQNFNNAMSSIFSQTKSVNYLSNNMIEFSAKTTNTNEEIVKLMQYGSIYLLKEDLPTISDIFIDIVRR